MASSKTGPAQDGKKRDPGTDLVRARETLAAIFAWRLINALCVRTFFQPDEYFQALEPAWQLVYGKDSGAWLTWVCPTLLPHTCLGSLRSPRCPKYQNATKCFRRNGCTACVHLSIPRYFRWATLSWRTCWSLTRRSRHGGLSPRPRSCRLALLPWATGIPGGSPRSSTDGTPPLRGLW